MDTNLKKCITCNEEKSLNDFPLSKGKPREKCKICLKEYMSNHYKENKKVYIDYSKQKQKENREWFKNYKSTLECSICGENHPAVIDFHHNDPSTKERNVTDMMKFSMDKIKKEINKCTILCSNCHRKLHWNEKYK